MGRRREQGVPVLADLQLNRPPARLSRFGGLATSAPMSREAVARCLAFSAYVWAVHRAHKDEKPRELFCLRVAPEFENESS